MKTFSQLLILFCLGFLTSCDWHQSARYDGAARLPAIEPATQSSLESESAEGDSYLGVKLGSGFKASIRHRDQPEEVHFQRAIIVADVLPDSPASAAGIVRGDLIFAIDGISVEDDNAAAFAARIRKLPAGKEITLTIGRWEWGRQTTPTSQPAWMPTTELQIRVVPTTRPSSVAELRSCPPLSGLRLF